MENNLAAKPLDGLVDKLSHKEVRTAYEKTYAHILSALKHILQEQ